MEAVISHSNYHSTPGLFIQFVLLVFISVSLMAFDSRKSEVVKPIRTAFAITAYPLQWLVDVPYKTYNKMEVFYNHQADLMIENYGLRQQLLLYQARYQDMVNIEGQNERLRIEYRAKKREGYEFSLAEILSASNDGVRKIVTLNKGSRDGVYEKQVVLAGGNIYGQVLEVTPNSSTVIQIIDNRHALPVRNLRTGILGLAMGEGQSNEVVLNHVIVSGGKVKEGDIFVTSGLDRLFPPDFPVSQVVQDGIQYGKGDQFASIKTRTLVDFEDTREVLLLWPKNHLAVMREKVKAKSNREQDNESLKQGVEP